MLCKRGRFLVYSLAFFSLVILQLFPIPHTLTPALAEWPIDLDPPTCSIPATRPDISKGVAVNSTAEIDVQATDPSGINNLTFTVNPTSTLNLTGSVGIGTTSLTQTYTWNPTVMGLYEFTVQAEDPLGNTNSDCISPKPSYTAEGPQPPTPGFVECPTPQRGQTTTTALLKWAPPSSTLIPIDYYKITVSPPCGTISNYQTVGTPTSLNIPYPTPTPGVGCAVNQNYDWTIQSCNNSGGPEICGTQTPPSSFFCAPPSAWLQTSGGDVHSNR